MKIIQIVQGISNLSAGPTYSVGSIAHYLSEKGHDVQLFALGSKPKAWPYKVTLKLFDGSLVRLGLMPYKAWRYIRTEMTATQAIIHEHGVWRILNLVPLAISNKANVKIVWSPRGMFSLWSWNFKAYVKKPFWFLLQKPALSKVDCFHATSQEEVDDIRRLGFTQPVALIPNGVELPEQSKLAKRKENKIVFLSRIHTKKGIHLLIKSWAKLAIKYPDWKLEIAGKLDSAYADEMLLLAKSLNVERIEFMGEVLGDDKIRFLSRAKLFVLPSFSENFGIAIAEALAHGTPVITTVHTPWFELENKQCGWCIEATENALTITMEQALSLSDQQLESMGKNGRVWMEQDFSWAVITEKMEAVYQWLLNKRNIPKEIQV